MSVVEYKQTRNLDIEYRDGKIVLTTTTTWKTPEGDMFRKERATSYLDSTDHLPVGKMVCEFYSGVAVVYVTTDQMRELMEDKSWNNVGPFTSPPYTHDVSTREDPAEAEGAFPTRDELRGHAIVMPTANYHTVMSRVVVTDLNASTENQYTARSRDGRTITSFTIVGQPILKVGDRINLEHPIDNVTINGETQV